MSTRLFKDDFIDRIKEEGRAEGQASMVLRILAARGFDVPGRVRERVLSCTDPGQLENWADKAVTASSLEAVFPDDQ